MVFTSGALPIALPRSELIVGHRGYHTVWVPLAVLWEDDPLIKVEWHSAVLAAMVEYVIVSVVVHEAEPLEERVEF